MNQCPPGPQVFNWSHSEFFRKFVEIFTNECLSPVSMTPAINCLVVSTTLAINPCPGFSVIAGDINLSLVTTTPAITLSPVTTTPVNNYRGDNDTGNKFIAGDQNKDAMEVGSCQRGEKCYCRCQQHR